jgi:hypothetical protein
MAQVALTTPSVALWDEDWASDINTKQWQYYSKNNIDDSADATVNPDEAWRRYSAARAPLEMAACRDAARAAKRAAKRAGANATGGQSGRSGGEQRLNPGTKLVADESEDEDGDDEDDYDSEHCECYIAPSHLRSMVADAVSSFPGLTEQVGKGASVALEFCWCCFKTLAKFSSKRKQQPRFVPCARVGPPALVFCGRIDVTATCHTKCNVLQEPLLSVFNSAYKPHGGLLACGQALCAAEHSP